MHHSTLEKSLVIGWKSVARGLRLRCTHPRGARPRGYPRPEGGPWGGGGGLGIGPKSGVTIPVNYLISVLAFKIVLRLYIIIL